MTVSKLKEKLYERISLYWGGATVVWGATKKVKPNAPLVVLRLGSVTRPIQPIAIFVNGNYIAAYPTETTLQIDLFTRGRLSEDGYYENTAENDLLRFANYIDSPATVNWCAQNDISLQLMNGVQDLSEVINDTQWSYRAMVELSIGFTEWAAEYDTVLGDDNVLFDENGNPVGIDNSDWEQTASGGGTQPLADEITGFFTEAEISEVDENG